MILLAADTSGFAASCAIYENNVLKAERYLNNRLTHSQTFLPMVHGLLNDLNLTTNDIDLYAVTTGPGSFTGLRIGIATIKGLSVIKNTPCVGISTLIGLAYNLKDCNAVICPVMDARCGQVYNALFSSQDGQISRLCEDRALMIEDLQLELSSIEKPIFLVGDAAEICYNKINQKNIAIAPPHLMQQRASAIALAAFDQIIKTPAESCAALMPAYLKLPQAQRERNEKLKKDCKK